MQLYFMLLISLFLFGCTQTPEPSSFKEIVAQQKIETNKTEAQLAKDEYIKLQKQRYQE